jgi:hypothetical protein
MQESRFKLFPHDEGQLAAVVDAGAGGGATLLVASVMALAACAATL